MKPFPKSELHSKYRIFRFALSRRGSHFSICSGERIGTGSRRRGSLRPVFLDLISLRRNPETWSSAVKPEQDSSYSFPEERMDVLAALNQSIN